MDSMRYSTILSCVKILKTFRVVTVLNICKIVLIFNTFLKSLNFLLYQNLSLLN